MSELANAIFGTVEKLSGGSISELKEKGSINYPNIPRGSQHHAQAAQDVTRNLSPFLGPAGAVGATNLMGGALELYEATQGSKLFSRDTEEDFKANLTGSLRGAGANNMIRNLLKRKFQRKNSP